jgi:hypothetical protein
MWGLNERPDRGSSSPGHCRLNGTRSGPSDRALTLCGAVPNRGRPDRRVSQLCQVDALNLSTDVGGQWLNLDPIELHCSFVAPQPPIVPLKNLTAFKIIRSIRRSLGSSAQPTRDIHGWRALAPPRGAQSSYRLRLNSVSRPSDKRRSESSTPFSVWSPEVCFAPYSDQKEDIAR